MKRKSKYNVDTSKRGEKKRTFDGHTFDSAVEMNYYKDILLPLKASGEILRIEIQPKYLLQPGFTKNGNKILPIYYIADFEVHYKDRIEAIDIKGFSTPEFQIKSKIFNYVYQDIPLLILGYSKIDGGYVDVKVIEKNRKLRKKQKQQS